MPNANTTRTLMHFTVIALSCLGIVASLWPILFRKKTGNPDGAGRRREVQDSVNTDSN